MKYCPYCGAGLQDEMKFCPKCGQRHQDATAGVEEVNEGLPTIKETTGEEKTLVAVETKEPEVRVYETKKKSKAPIIIITCLLMVVVAAAVYLIGLGGNQEKVSGVDRVTDAANSVLYLEVFDDEKELIATASGFVIEDGTTLITNYHVIEDAYHIVAWTPDGGKSVDVSNIIVYDEDSDIAVLKCDSNIGVQPLVLGDSESVEQGDAIYAVGYPLGLAHTLSDGVISSRYVDELGTDILQITAPISSGSSGGALLNSEGQVIGIICASYMDGQNINLAVSVSSLISLQQGASKADCISLHDFYNQFLHPKALSVVLANKMQYLDKEVILSGYVSAIDIPNNGGIIALTIVGTPEEVIGQITHGYPFRNEVEVVTHEYCWELLSNQQAIEIYSSVKSSAFTEVMPGDYITIEGVLYEMENAEALHDYTANTLHMLLPKLLDVK